MRPLCSLLVFVATTFAQPLTFGVKGGVPLTENYEAGSGNYTDPQLSAFSSSSKTLRYTVGATVTLLLPRRFGLEADALYHRLDYDWFQTGGSRSGVYQQWGTFSGNRVEVPILLRWSPGGRLYVVAGPDFAFNAGNDQSERTTYQYDYPGTTIGPTSPSDLRTGKGVTFGLGYDARSGPLHIKPELRYAHWTTTSFETYLNLRQRKNEVVFLLGFELGGRP